MDIDVDKIAMSVKSLSKCSSKSLQLQKQESRTPDGSAASRRLQQHSEINRRAQRESRPMQVDQLQPVYHPQLTPRQMGVINGNIENIANTQMCSSPGMAIHPDLMSMSEQDELGIMCNPSSEDLISYDKLHPHSDGQSLNNCFQMEVPYTEEFAWPFERKGNSPGDEAGSEFQQPHRIYPLTKQDIAAFMRINPGDKPFLQASWNQCSQ